MQTEELLDRARAGFTAAAAATPATERRLRVGGRPVLLEAIGEVADVLRSPMVHLEAPDDDRPPDLTIHAWADTGAERALDLAVWAGGEDPGSDERVRYADLGQDRCAMAWPTERMLEGFERGEGHSEAWWWVPDVKRTPLAELAMPFRPILHWWTAALGLQMVHAAAVGTPEHGAVLLAGRSGSGKSTTSLFALRSDVLRFLGDDYVLVDPDGPEVFSLYTTAKIHEPDQDRVPHVRGEVVGRQEGDKLIAFLAEPYGDHLVERLPLRAILCPQVTAEGPHLEPIGAGEALRRLAPSTILQFPGAEPGALLSSLRRLTETVPAFHFALGPDPAATTSAIEAFLSSR
jgi:hypothetical protein